MESKLIYKALPVYGDRAEVLKILADGSRSDLMLLSLAVGESFPDWKFAQDICLKLLSSEDEGIRANACLGLAYVARTKQRLEKHLVKPYLLRELKSQTELKWRIEDAIDDINRYLGWKISKKSPPVSDAQQASSEP